jgi:hypothetical protein
MEQAAINKAPAPSCPIGAGPAMDYVKEVQVSSPERFTNISHCMTFISIPTYTKNPSLINSQLGLFADIFPQNRFLPDRADVFQRFLSLLADYAKDPNLNKVPDVHRQVRELFTGEPDLAEGFEQFLPESMLKKGNKVVDVGKGNGNGDEDEDHEEMAVEHEVGKDEGR